MYMERSEMLHKFLRAIDMKYVWKEVIYFIHFYEEQSISHKYQFNDLLELQLS